MEFLKSLSPSEILLYLTIIGLLIASFFMKGKRKNGSSIKIKNSTQAEMLKKYNKTVKQFNELMDEYSGINSLIQNEEIRFKTEDDCVLFEKKVKDFNYCYSRAISILNELPNLINKTQKKSFTTHCKDIDVYINQMKTLMIELGTIINNDSFKQEDYNAALSQLGNILNTEEISL